VTALVLTVDERSRPVGLVPVRETVSRVARDLAHGRDRIEIIVADETRRWRSKHLDLPTPVVVRWPGYVELPDIDRSRVSRRVLFARDGYRCQYCGFRARPGKALAQLTLDHVKPAHLFPTRAAATSWDNVTTACFACNNRKGGRLPMESGMWPRTTPKEPGFVQLRFGGRLTKAQRDYVKDYFGSAPHAARTGGPASLSAGPPTIYNESTRR
jgi:5-methylcytosine-specific restriction endonuclease McrA